MANFWQPQVEQMFGWQFNRAKTPEPVGLSPRESDDGSINTIAAPAAGTLGTLADFSNYSIRSEFELIQKYREMSGQPEVDAAIEEIVCEAIASQGEEPDTVKIILDDLRALNPNIKTQIEIAFSEVTELLDIRHHAYDIFRRWYIDGRMYFQVIIDKDHPELGIQELRMVDARKIRKVREFDKVRVKSTDGTFAILSQVKNEYFVFSDTGIQGPALGGDQPLYGATSGLKISKDSMIYVTSGIVDFAGWRILSFLHPAIKPLNQLRMLEDAAVIFRMSRAPERRVWKVEVGNLPRMKAEQYLRDLMLKQKNRLSYDSSSGEIRDERKFQTILEDYWLPVRNGVGTQVSVLPPGNGLGTADIEYFLKRLYASLKLPTGRLDPDNQLNFAGAATSISREEVRFGKFISRLRVRFSQLFLQALEKQLVLKNIMTLDDFARFKPYIRFDYIKDNYFMEIKDQQIMQARLDLLNNIMPFVGTFYSNEWIKKNILKQNDEEIIAMSQQIMGEGPPVVYADQGGAPAEGSNGQAGPPQMGRSGKSMTMGGESPRNPPEAQNPFMKNGSKGDFRQVAKILSRGT